MEEKEIFDQVALKEEVKTTTGGSFCLANKGTKPSFKRIVPIKLVMRVKSYPSSVFRFSCRKAPALCTKPWMG